MNSSLDNIKIMKKQTRHHQRELFGGKWYPVEYFTYQVHLSDYDEEPLFGSFFYYEEYVNHGPSHKGIRISVSMYGDKIMGTKHEDDGEGNFLHVEEIKDDDHFFIRHVKERIIIFGNKPRINFLPEFEVSIDLTDLQDHLNLLVKVKKILEMILLSIIVSK